MSPRPTCSLFPLLTVSVTFLPQAFANAAASLPSLAGFPRLSLQAEFKVAFFQRSLFSLWHPYGPSASPLPFLHGDHTGQLYVYLLGYYIMSVSRTATDEAERICDIPSARPLSSPARRPPAPPHPPTAPVRACGRVSESILIRCKCVSEMSPCNILHREVGGENVVFGKASACPAFTLPVLYQHPSGAPHMGIHVAGRPESDLGVLRCGCVRRVCGQVSEVDFQ